jgi:hypothetical protein
MPDGGGGVKTTKTQSAARRANELAERKKSERDPLVAAVLERVPGAEIIAVSTPGPGDPAELEDD